MRVTEKYFYPSCGSFYFIFFAQCSFARFMADLYVCELKLTINTKACYPSIIFANSFVLKCHNHFLLWLHSLKYMYVSFTDKKKETQKKITATPPFGNAQTQSTVKGHAIYEQIHLKI